MSPSFITGKTGTVLNAYTKPEYRHRGYAKKLMAMMLVDAKAQDMSVIELKSTEDGYSLYKSVGFEDVTAQYHNMKNQKRCKEVCSDKEYDMLEKAFFDKENNLRK